MFIITAIFAGIISASIGAFSTACFSVFVTSIAGARFGRVCKRARTFAMKSAGVFAVKFARTAAIERAAVRMTRAAAVAIKRAAAAAMKSCRRVFSRANLTLSAVIFNAGETVLWKLVKLRFG